MSWKSERYLNGEGNNGSYVEQEAAKSFSASPVSPLSSSLVGNAIYFNLARCRKREEGERKEASK